jgi:hypothetical protein
MTRRSAGALVPVLWVFAITQLALGLWMAISPGSFFDDFGPFGARNDHYVRDVSTFYIALGAAGLVAVRRPRWRVPLLAFATIEYALHAINHLADIGDSHPAWNGPVTFASVTAGGLVIAWMLWEASREERASARGAERDGQ